MPVRKTSVEINEELLRSAQQVLATRTVKDTVERAFQEVVRAAARREEIRALTEQRGMDLADSEIMSRAWR